MANRIFLLCLLVSLLSVCYIDCKGGHSSHSSHGSHKSHGSHHFGWGSWFSSKPSSSSSSHSYPSSPSGLSGGSPHGYSSSSSRLSGSGSSGSSGWNYGSSSYHSSSSGLSRSGSSSYDKPLPSWASSGSNFGSSSYGSNYAELRALSQDFKHLQSLQASLYNKTSSSLGSSWKSGSSRNSSSSSGLSDSGSSYNDEVLSILGPNIPSFLLSGSGSYYKPSSTSGSILPSGYPSSSPGRQESGSGTNSYKSASSSPIYPFGTFSNSSSSSNLSGGLHNYSLSNSGFSGSSKYPSSSSGLFGSSTGSSIFPSTSPRSSGFHNYSSSQSGSSYKPLSSWRSHSHPLYPTGTSGSQSNNNNYKPTHKSNTNSGHSTAVNHTTHYYHHNVSHSVPTYYTAPQYAYINEYRHSNSRYGDLLTGLSLYNLGRSHNHYQDHYYYDDYYRRKYNNPSSASDPSYSLENKSQDRANCILKVKENGRVEVLKIPCEIVSTFTQGSKKVPPSEQTQVNKTVCTTTVQAVPVMPVLSTFPAVTVNSSLINSTMTPMSNNYKTGLVNGFDASAVLSAFNNALPSGSSLDVMTSTLGNISVTGMNVTVPKNVSFANSTVATNSSALRASSVNITKTVTAVNASTVNVTVCTTNSAFVDPLTVLGPPVDAKDMECVVEIQTKDAFLSNVVDCSTLIAYAKMPEPKKDTGILPQRAKLKSWLANPPWWMSLFIAV